jgi:hypothetical protein
MLWTGKEGYEETRVEFGSKTYVLQILHSQGSPAVAHLSLLHDKKAVWLFYKGLSDNPSTHRSEAVAAAREYFSLLLDRFRAT